MKIYTYELLASVKVEYSFPESEVVQEPDGSDGDMIPTDTALRDLEQFLLETLSLEFAINSVELHVDSDNFLGTSPAGDA